jgi:outer membrane protein assembly factor BamB
VHAENWDRFRGPNGAGQSEAAGIASEWTEADYLWKKSLPGVGHSSPVVWGDRVFVTSGDPKSGEQIVLAFDAKSGGQLWEKRFASHTYSMHSDNSYATSTPAADADQLYVLWLDGDRVTLAALTHDGSEVWRHQVGSLVEQHGFGTSPVVVGDMVCVANETNSADRSIVTGVDRMTGDIRWTVPRSPGKTAFATPCVLESGGRKLLVMSSMGSGVTAYDPATGEIACRIAASARRLWQPDWCSSRAAPATTGCNSSPCAHARTACPPSRPIASSKACRTSRRRWPQAVCCSCGTIAAQFPVSTRRPASRSGESG